MKAQIAAKYLQFIAKKNANKNAGFTLIELLVVIIIIGILSAIALPSFLNQAAKARASEARTNVGAMNRSQQAYYLENQTFAEDATLVPAVLGLGVKPSANYGYKAAPIGAITTAVANYATSKKTDLKSTVGGVFKAASTTDSILCEEETATVATTDDATAPASATACGATTINLGNK